MRAYLPISHSDLLTFLFNESFKADIAFAPTQSFIDANSDCDEEEIEYRLSILAGQAALELRASQSSPGLIVAVELKDEQCGQCDEDSIARTLAITWDQVQCVFLSHSGDDELVWFATQEISVEIDKWK